MRSKALVIGIDFGTESARGVLCQVIDGVVLASTIHRYSRGVISEALPGSDEPLPPKFALHDPGDYITAVEEIVPSLLRQADARAADVIGIGLDTTSCTMLPLDEKLEPLCWKENFRSNPHAWIKLWKHHASEAQAERITRVARRRGEPFLARYGGRIQSEWFFPKLLEIIEKAPEVYAEAAHFVHVGDWLVWWLTGCLTRSEGLAGYKEMWDRHEGYPSLSFFQEVHPTLAEAVTRKLGGRFVPLGGCAGRLLPERALRLGLAPGIAVASSNIDAHCTAVGAGLREPGTVALIMGTSLCHMAVDERFCEVPGIGGIVRDGILPGYFGYEAGQPALGDLLGWFVEHQVPCAIVEAARQRGVSVHQVLEEQASRLPPGGSGLLALDWWNGNRSILADADLSGLVVGYTLSTRPHEIYRALIEGAAFGTRRILDAFEKGGLAVRDLIATGGIPRRNRLLVQVFADVTGRTIRIAGAEHAGALGAAIHAAVAAGPAAGGYASVQEAAARMVPPPAETVAPTPGARRIYDEIYEEYKRLHDWFGTGSNPLMRRLQRLRSQWTTLGV